MQRLSRSLLLTMCMGSAGAVHAAGAPVCGPAVEGRPRVGLVLSGGGARGAAHIGVLERLEELRVPVDCIAGTSAGAIVGGLYAAGLAPDEIAQVFTGIDWDKAFSDKPGRRARSFRRKLDDATFLPNLEFGLKQGTLMLPTGVVAGQNINTALKSASLRTAFVRDFDRLRIPFRAVATDITTGEMVVIQRGDLAHAMRASMSVPGIFAPVELDGRLLVDGGLVRNVPIDLARGMGAEVLVVVNAGTPLASREQLADIFGLSVQVINVLTQQNVDRSLTDLGADDVLLVPDLEDIGATEFDRTSTAIVRGAAAAAAASGALARLGLDEPGYATWQASQRQAAPPPPLIGFVEVVDNQRVPTERILARVRTRPGEPLLLVRLHRDVERIFAMDDFEQVYFDLIERDGRVGVQIRVREKAWGPHYLKFGLKIADDFEGGSRFSLLGHHLLTNANRHGGEWRTDISLGEARLLRTEFRQPFTSEDTWFVAVEAGYESNLFDVFVGDERVAEFRRQVATAGVDVGREISNFGELRFGWRSGHGRADRRVGPPVLFAPGEHLAQTRVSWTVDQLDDPYFPSDGYYARVHATWNLQRYGADSDYERYAFTAGGAHTLGGQTVVVEAELGSSSGVGLPVWEEHTLGGFLSLSGLRQNQLRGDRLVAARLITWRKVPYLPDVLGGHMRMGGSLEAGNTGIGPAGSSLDVGDLRIGGSLFVAADTFLGPVHLAVGFADRADPSVYFFLGRTF